MALSPRRVWSLGLALGALSFATTLAAQQPAAARPAPTVAPTAPAADPELAAFAKAYVAVGLVRDEFDAQLALPKNKTVELQTQVREAMKKKVEQAIQANGLTVDAYRRIEYSVTIDAARRAAFDRILAGPSSG